MQTQTPTPQTKQSEAVAEAGQNEFQKLLQKTHRAVSVFETSADFAHAQRVAKMLIGSPMVPAVFRGEANLGNAVIAVDIAFRLKMNVLLVMNQIYIVYGKPGFSAQFCIAVMNTAADFGKIRYDRRDIGKLDVPYSYTVRGDNGSKAKKTGVETISDVEVVAWALEGKDKLPTGINTLAKAKATGLPILEGPPVSLSMAIKDGWFHRNDSKWQTMPEVMLKYRAATFFGRLYAPELLMGLQTIEELEDITGGSASEPAAAAVPIFTEAKPQQQPEPVKVLAPAKLKMVEEVTEALKIDETHSMGQAKKATAELPRTVETATTIARVKELAAKSCIGVGALIDYIVGIGSVAGDPASLEEIQMENETILSLLVEQWDDIASRIKNQKTS